MRTRGLNAVTLPLGQRPGVGTLCNVLVIGLAVDAALALPPPVPGLPARGVLLNALATAA